MLINVCSGNDSLFILNLQKLNAIFPNSEGGYTMRFENDITPIDSDEMRDICQNLGRKEVLGTRRLFLINLKNVVRILPTLKNTYNVFFGGNSIVVITEFAYQQISASIEQDVPPELVILYADNLNHPGEQENVA